MHTGTRKITEGAMMSALVGLLLFLNRQFAGLLEYATYWILSFPILVYTVKYDWKAALLPSTAMLLLSLMISMPTTTFYLASALLCGMVYGYGINRKWPNQWLLLVSGILTLLSYLITMVLFAAVFGYDPKEDIIMATYLMDALHIDGINIVQIALLVSVVLSITTAILQTICVHLFAVLILRRMRLPSPQLQSVFDCTVPKWIGWISICIWLLFSLQNVLKLEGNILVLLISLYIVDMILLCGECIMNLLCLSLIMQKRLLGILSALGCVIGLMFAPTRMIIAFFGIWSILGSWRRKWKRGGVNGTIRKS